MSNIAQVIVPNSENMEEIVRLTKDLLAGSRLLNKQEARYLVDYYYAIQDFRMQAAAQMKQAADSGEPNHLLQWVFTSMKRIEDNIQKALRAFAEEYNIGNWLMSITGIGPVITAGLLAHLDIKDRPTAGHFWRFAGLDPTLVWEKKTKRPWNAKLKVLTWKAGESFIKFQNNQHDYYGKLFVTRKRREWERNLRGDLAEQCDAILAKKTFGAETNAVSWYSGEISSAWAKMILELGEGFPMSIPKDAKTGQGTKMLPPAHIHARARRWVTKIFLSHVHHAMYSDYYGTEPPIPYAFAKLPNEDHRHFIELPNWPFECDAKSLQELIVPESTKGKPKNTKKTKLPKGTPEDTDEA